MSTDKLFETLISQEESERIDFKEKYDNVKHDFLHDALSLFNTPTPGEKYLVFGVSDNKEVKGLDDFLRSNILNDFLAKASLSNIFSVQVLDHFVEELKISIVIIPENNIGPVVLKSDKYSLKKDHVYVRNGDTNTGKSETAPPDVIAKIEKLAERNRRKEIPEQLNETAGRDSSENILIAHEEIHLLFHKAIKNYQNWDKTREFDYNLDDDVETYFYKYNMDFTITVVSHLNDFREPWAQDALDPKAFSYLMQLRYKGIKIDEVIYVSTDGARAENVVPTQKFYSEGGGEGTFYYYYIRDSLKYDLNVFINEGSHSYLDRTSLKEFPIFSSESDALEAIEEDYRFGKRLLLSYTTMKGHDERYGTHIRRFDKFPRYLNGEVVPANEYEARLKDIEK